MSGETTLDDAVNGVAKLRAIASGLAPGMTVTTLTPAEAQAILDWYANRMNEPGCV